jgi:hypothetical protein
VLICAEKLASGLLMDKNVPGEAAAMALFELFSI